MKKSVTGWIVSAGGALALAGCITHEETVYRDTERARVEFETDAAARVFYEAMTEHPVRRSPSESNTEVKLPLVFEHKRRVVDGQNVAFNEAVALCDTNQDGRITEAEARIFAEQRKRR